MKMRKTKTPRYYYHITTKDWGDSIVLKPIGNSESFSRPFDEPKIRRTCVAPTVCHCIVAIGMDDCVYNVYRTKEKVLAYFPYGVIDSCVTREKWIISKCEFIKVGEISADKAFAHYYLSDIKKQRKLLNKLLKDNYYKM